MKIIKKINKKAFTLVELIVVMLVLAILSTLWFTSYINYTWNSRDSARKSDFKNIETNLELYKVWNGIFPDPSTWVDITFSWSKLWTQWTFWESVIRSIWNMVELPVDPKVWNEYSYSISNSKKEYEIATMLEHNDIGFSPVKNTYAADTFRSFVVWNYNWKVSKVSTWSTLHILAVPSIITTDIDLSSYESIVSANKLVYSGKYNLADSYKISDYDLNWETWVMVNSSDYILINKTVWDNVSSFSDADFIQVWQKIQASYTWTILTWEDQIKSIISADVSDNTEAKQLWESIINTVFK